MEAYLGERIGLESLVQRCHEGRFHMLAQHGDQAGSQLLVSLSKKSYCRIAHTSVAAAQVCDHPINEQLDIQTGQPKLLDGLCHPGQRFAEHLHGHNQI